MAKIANTLGWKIDGKWFSRDALWKVSISKKSDIPAFKFFATIKTALQWNGNEIKIWNSLSFEKILVVLEFFSKRNKNLTFQQERIRGGSAMKRF
jgi:hypothetical protein